MSPPIHTVGHSTLDADAFLALLACGAVEHVVDVRRHAGSRRFPHFNPPALASLLRGHGLAYSAAPALGGRRKAAPASPNGYWENVSFRAYADYAMTPEFDAALDALCGLARTRRCAVMCAEAVWWRCHRRIIADYLLARGVHVLHLLPPDQVVAASLTPAARPTEDGRLLYPASAD